MRKFVQFEFAIQRIRLAVNKMQEKQRKKKKLHEVALIPYREKYESFSHLIIEYQLIYRLHKLKRNHNKLSCANKRDKGREK